MERGDQEGTRHFQGFLILKQKQRLAWLKSNINQRAHWEPMKGSPKQARDYCRKEETRVSGPFEFGSWPYKESEGGKKMSEIREEAYQECDQLKLGYKRPQNIQASILMCPGFIPAMKELCADILGPYRPDLRVITMIGPPGVGKSYAIQQFFPDHGRCIYANNGVWFQNPCEKVMIFEEFHGQIPLGRMLEFLDVYPLALEVKGGMRPAMYTLAVLTSNTSPRFWYPIKKSKDDEDGTEYQRRVDATHALWDRIGYSDGSYIPVRKNNLYLECPSPAFGPVDDAFIKSSREYFWNNLANYIGEEPIEEDPDMPELELADHPIDDSLNIEDEE